MVSQKINSVILDSSSHFIHFSSCALKTLKLQSNSQKVLLLPSTIHSRQLLHFSLKYLITTHSSTLLVLVLILNKKTIRKLNPLSHLLPPPSLLLLNSLSFAPDLQLKRSISTPISSQQKKASPHCQCSEEKPLQLEKEELKDGALQRGVFLVVQIAVV